MLANGDVLCMDKGKITLANSRIQADDIYIDGNDINGLSTAVIRDRKILSEDGLVAVLISLDSRNNKLLVPPTIYTRGFVYYSSDLIQKATNRIQKELEELMQNKVTFGEIKNLVRGSLARYLFIKTKRNPIIIPVIMNLNNQ